MKFIKENYKIVIVLYIFWIILTMDLGSINLIVGLSLSIIVAIGSRSIIYDEQSYKVGKPTILSMIRFTVRLIFEIYKSSLSYIVRIIKQDCEPIFVTIKLETNNPLIITMISNAITLTPGTLTVDTDKNKLVVLSIDDPEKRGDNLAEEIKEKYEKIFIKKG